MKELKLMIYKRIVKLFQEDCKAPIENYFIMVQHSLYRYITKIVKDDEFVANYLKPGITLRMQQLLPEERIYLLDSKSYQVYF